MQVTTETVNGKKVGIHVLANGQFYAEVGDETVQDVTLEGLKKKLQGVARRLRKTIRIPAVLLSHWDGARGRGWDRIGVERVALTGVHAGRRHAVLYRDAHGKAGEIDGYDVDVLRELTTDEEGTLADAIAAFESARDALDAVVRPLVIDAKQVVGEAIGADDEEG